MLPVIPGTSVQEIRTGCGPSWKPAWIYLLFLMSRWRNLSSTMLTFSLKRGGKL